jgi:hypothetical protein
MKSLLHRKRVSSKRRLLRVLRRQHAGITTIVHVIWCRSTAMPALPREVDGEIMPICRDLCSARVVELRIQKRVIMTNHVGPLRQHRRAILWPRLPAMEVMTSHRITPAWLPITKPRTRKASIPVWCKATTQCHEGMPGKVAFIRLLCRPRPQRDITSRHRKRQTTLRLGLTPQFPLLLTQLRCPQ